MQFLHDGFDEDSVVPGGFWPSWPSLYEYLSRLRRSSRGTFSYQGGLEMVRYSRYLAAAAQAKVGIDLPGLGDLCFRLIDYLAIGSCVIGPRPSTRLHTP